MRNIRAIRTEADYYAALARIDVLMDAAFGTPDGDELDVLTDLVEIYEARHAPMGYPSPLEALRFRMEQGGLSPRDLVPLLGSRAKVSEILSGKRSLTMQMARTLHTNLGIPADVLLQQPGGSCPAPWRVSSGNVSRSPPWPSVGGLRNDPISSGTLKRSCGI